MKYNNRRFVSNKTCYDSKGECKRHQELKLLERVKQITNLKTQVEFELQPGFEIDGKKIRPIKYIADFTYNEGDTFVVEDYKGFKTTDYKLKAKMFAYKYGFRIKETR